MVARERRGGLLVRVDGVLSFLPASIVVRVAPTPRITRVASSPPELLGVAIHEGEVLPVIVLGTPAIGPSFATMIVCTYADELLGFVGAELVASGIFDAAPDAPDSVLFAGETARCLDIGAIHARLQTGARTGRWGA